MDRVTWFKHHYVRTAKGCLEWKGTRNKGGYGRVNEPILGERLAHRIAYTLAHGPIPDGLLVRHSCDNPPCGDLAHLLLGTHADNHADSLNRGRHKPLIPRCGRDNHAAKLSPEDVVSIRERYAMGGITQRALAIDYGVVVSVVCEIINKKAWVHV